MNNKRRLSVLYIIITISFVTILIGNNISAAQKDLDIQVLAQNIEKQNGTIIEWSLYARELVYLSDEKERLEKIHWLKNQYSDMEWNTVNESGSEVVIGQQNFEFYSEIIKLISTDKNGQSSTYLLYEIRGAGWNQNIAENLSNDVTLATKKLFDKKPVIFSCIKGEFSKRFHEFKYQSLDGLMKSFQAEEIKTLKESDFYSISGKSSLFAQNLSFADTEMNIQFGLRKSRSGSTTNFVIGTPILTIEY